MVKRSTAALECSHTSTGLSASSRTRANDTSSLHALDVRHQDGDGDHDEIRKRAVEEVAEAILAAPVALGTVVNLEREVSVALAAPHEEALEVVRATAVKHADETSWKLAGALCWLWAAATTTVAAFVIHGTRGASGLTALLGMEIQGIVCGDRWGPYNRVPESRRQICWAHLKRDFQKVVDRGGTGEGIGHAGLRVVERTFTA